MPQYLLWTDISLASVCVCRFSARGSPGTAPLHGVAARQTLAEGGLLSIFPHGCCPILEWPSKFRLASARCEWRRIFCGHGGFPGR